MTVTETKADVSAGMLFEQWLNGFGEAVARSDYQQAVSCFASDGYWKDSLAFT